MSLEHDVLRKFLKPGTWVRWESQGRVVHRGEILAHIPAGAPLAASYGVGPEQLLPPVYAHPVVSEFARVVVAVVHEKTGRRKILVPNIGSIGRFGAIMDREEVKHLLAKSKKPAKAKK